MILNYLEHCWLWTSASQVFGDSFGSVAHVGRADVDMKEIK